MKQYLITGGTDGIGRAIVERLLEDSDKEDLFIVNYGHNDEKAKAFLESLSEEKRRKVKLEKADMSSQQGLEEFIACLDQDHIMLDLAVLNIGTSEYAKFDDYTFEMWNRTMQVNLTIPVFLLQKLKSRMRENGSILLMGSYAGVKEYSSSVVYSISKAGIVFLAKVMVKEFEPIGVRINAIAPGFIETAWQNGRSDESRKRINQKIAMHRFGSPREVADISAAVLKNTYINGEIVNIHGGYEYF